MTAHYYLYCSTHDGIRGWMLGATWRDRGRQQWCSIVVEGRRFLCIKENLTGEHLIGEQVYTMRSRARSVHLLRFSADA